MLRITVERQVALVLLVLEGRLCGAWVEELRKVISGLAPEASVSRLVIALTSVSGVDAEGRRLLAQLHAEGIRFAGSGLSARTLIDEITQSPKQDAENLQ
jgi:anti-anti-sigma regulatory factor